MSGIRFPEETSLVFLYIDNVQMETLSATDTEAVFAIHTMQDYYSSNVKMMTDIGLPLGYNTYSSLTLEPVLLSIEPKDGSAAGTLITVYGSGFGTETENLGLFY